MKIETVFGPAEFGALTRRDLSGAVAIVFDILRATSSMVTALENGASAIRPVLEIAEALAWRQKEPTSLLAGERHGLRIRAAETGSIDFDMGNSPREFTAERVAGRSIIVTTTNGTRALTCCAGAKHVFAAAFLNLAATLDHVAGLKPELVILVCAGTFEEPAYEDILAAGASCEYWTEKGEELELSDASAAVWQTWKMVGQDLLGALRHSKNARRLLSQPDLAGDVAICVARNRSKVVAEMENGVIRVVHPE